MILNNLLEKHSQYRIFAVVLFANRQFNFSKNSIQYQIVQIKTYLNIFLQNIKHSLIMTFFYVNKKHKFITYDSQPNCYYHQKKMLL